MQLQFVCLLCRDAKSFEIGETVHTISPQSVLIISQKGTVTLILGVLREIFYANYIYAFFVCSFFRGRKYICANSHPFYMSAF